MTYFGQFHDDPYYISPEEEKVLELKDEVKRLADENEALTMALDALVQSVIEHYGLQRHETALGIARDEATAVLVKHGAKP